MDVATCSFKKKLAKALVNRNTHPLPPKNNFEVRLDRFSPRLNKIDRGGVGELGVIAVGKVSCGWVRKCQILSLVLQIHFILKSFVFICLTLEMNCFYLHISHFENFST